MMVFAVRRGLIADFLMAIERRGYVLVRLG